MKNVSAWLAGTAALLAAPLVLVAQQSSFGSMDDQGFARSLWSALEAQRLVGEDALSSKPYAGTDPHGSILVTLEGDLEVDGQRGAVLVKHNYMGDGITLESVGNDPEKGLMATTVMFKRAGFDSEQNWFWVKYLPDGSVDKTPDGMSMAGNVGMCVSCHEEAQGGDLVFLNDRHR